MKNFKFQISNFKYKKTGFTLVELMVAISILSISILATYTAVSNNLRASNFAEDQVAAYYLADEAVEFILNMRDTNAIANIQALSSGSSVPWLTGIANVSGDPCFNTPCKVDSHLKSLTSTGNMTSPFMTIDSNGFYGYSGSTQTNFTRAITVTVVSSTEAIITVNVSWSTAGVAKSYVLKETIRSWQ